MQIQEFSKDVEVITKLGDEPNIDDGLSADELRAKFDEGNVAIKQYLNGTLVPATNTALADAGSAKEIAESASVLAQLASELANKKPDTTLKKSGEAADAKAVGDKIDLLSEDVQEHEHAIRELTEKKLDSTGGVISGRLSVQDALSIGTPESGFYMESEPSAATSPKMQLYGMNGDEPVRIGGVAIPVSIGDAVNKGYVDSAIEAVSKLPGPPGAPGKDGVNGADGADGGYYAPSVTADGVLSWAASKPDMPPVQSANIKGTPGENGRGIVSVARTTGDGLAGTVDTYTITYTDGTTSTFTVRNGANGKSAYQLAVEAGFTGTLQEWLASLQGAPGQDGANGTDGGYYAPSVSDDGTLVFMASKKGMPPVVPIDLHEYISAILPGGYCSTGAAVADKIESYINREITAGSLVSIQFAGTNTADNPTLTVNGVKAAIVGGNGEAIAPSMLGAGERVFLYTTSQKWVLLNPQVDVLPAATAADSGKVATVGSNGSYGLAYPQMPVVATTVTNIEMQPNVKYKWGVATSLTLSFAPEVPGIVNEYCGEFFSSDPATNFACPLSVNWVTPLNIEVGKHYEFSIINGIGVIAGV